MGNRELYESFALQSVDAKGRVAIPGDLRSTMEHNSPMRQVVIRRSEDGLGLTCTDTEWSKERYAAMHRRAENALDVGREPPAPRFKYSERAPFDPSGRFLLTSYARENANIADWALFAGDGYVFHIYAPEVVMADPAIDPELREICAHLCRQRKVAF